MTEEQTPGGPEPEDKQPDARNKALADYLREWGFDLPTFEARAKKSVEAARGDLSEVTGALRQTMANTREVLVDLQKNRGPVAAELKVGFEQAWNAIEDSFARARQRMREAKTTVVDVKPEEPEEKKDE